MITGASSGIGRATAIKLAGLGANLALGARRVKNLESTEQDARRFGVDTVHVRTDVTSRQQVSKLVKTALDRWQRIDILFANAGEYIRSPVSELTVETLQRSMAVNFYGGVYAALEVLPVMKKQGSGHIIFMTTMDSKKGIPPDAPYVAAKFALTGFAEVLRQELKQTGIAVTNILPGRVDTSMIEDLEFQPVSAKISAEKVADAVVRALKTRQPELVIPRRAVALHYINVLSPRLGDYLVRRFQLSGWTKDIDHPDT